MKIFISSLISGFGSYREAAKRAVTTLRYEPIMAEDFGAQPTSPQIACLQGLRSSDIVVLILGEHYGTVPSGSVLSATHQEYREARGNKPVIAFVQQDVSPDPDQRAFIDEVQNWEGGLFRGGFLGPEDLRDGVTRALHDVTLANAVGPVDHADLLARAIRLIPADSRNQVSTAFLQVAIAGGPTQRILRPVQLEATALAEHLLQTAMFGEHRVFESTRSSKFGLDSGDLVIHQERGATIRLTEQGEILISLPLDNATPGNAGFGGMMVIVEEIVQKQLSNALAFAAASLEHIDATQRITDLAIATRISGAEYRTWRTRAQNVANPNSVGMSITGGGDRAPVTSAVRRAALRLDRANAIEDLLVPLRRQFATG